MIISKLVKEKQRRIDPVWFSFFFLNEPELPSITPVADYSDAFHSFRKSRFYDKRKKIRLFLLTWSKSVFKMKKKRNILLAVPHERICIFLGKNADGTELFFKLSGIYVHKYGFSLTVEFFNVLWVLVRRHTQDINVVQIGQSFNMNIIASEKNLSCSCVKFPN